MMAKAGRKGVGYVTASPPVNRRSKRRLAIISFIIFSTLICLYPFITHSRFLRHHILSIFDAKHSHSSSESLPDYGKIRRCTAPRSNSWSGLEKYESDLVLEEIQKHKGKLIPYEAGVFVTKNQFDLLNTNMAKNVHGAVNAQQIRRLTRFKPKW